MSGALDAEGQAQLDAALADWCAGRHYEAHELLEEVVEHFDADDPSFQIGLALIQVAAALHKLDAQVGPAAVPGKLEKALQVLRAAPAVWLGLDLSGFVHALDRFAARPDVQQGRAPGREVARPCPARAG